MRPHGILLFVALTAAVRAGETPAAPADSIAAAKKDLAGLRAQAGQADPGSGLPTIEMRDLGPSPGTLRPELPSVLGTQKETAIDPTRKKLGTGNWLVDAMDKNTGTMQAGRGKEKDEILRGDPDLLRGDSRLAAQVERDALAQEEAREKARPRDASGPVYNPLDAFMSGWVSAKDRDLLVPTARRDGFAGGDLTLGRVESLPGLDPVPSVESFLTAPDTSAISDLRPAANPYLALGDAVPGAALRSFAPGDVSGFAPEGSLDMPSRGISTMGAEPRAPDASRSYIPDFAQPTDDDKYFKQMKRF